MFLNKAIKVYNKFTNNLKRKIYFYNLLEEKSYINNTKDIFKL